MPGRETRLVPMRRRDRTAGEQGGHAENDWLEGTRTPASASFSEAGVDLDCGD